MSQKQTVSASALFHLSHFVCRLGHLKQCGFDKETVGVLSYRNYRYGLTCKREIISRPQVFHYGFLMGQQSSSNSNSNSENDGDSGGGGGGGGSGVEHCHRLITDSVVNLCVHVGDTVAKQPVVR